MKKLIIAISLLSLVACTKKTASTTPTTTGTSSTLNITLNGHTYNIAGAAMTSHTTSGSNPGYGNLNTLPSSVFKFGLEVTSNSKLTCLIGGIKGDISAGVGTYKVGQYPDLSIASSAYTNYGLVNITDLGDGGKSYTSADSNSTFTITVSNGNEIKGIFSLNLFYNGNYYPATGDFDYKY